ncbi:MAG: hypothetical protein QUV35_06340, partial [Hydrogenophaga sp.]|uniref:hypothetical protein n=1 Tax=Hydrogenophaga sp. TaxID=1904254 RepID=UPI00262B40F2
MFNILHKVDFVQKMKIVQEISAAGPMPPTPAGSRNRSAAVFRRPAAPGSEAPRELDAGRERS